MKQALRNGSPSAVELSSWCDSVCKPLCFWHSRGEEIERERKSSSSESTMQTLVTARRDGQRGQHPQI